MKTDYQIVIQWDNESIADFDSFIGIEDLLYEKLPARHVVDGHDAGCGELNIFILTDSPQAAFVDIEAVLDAQPYWQDARVAYRKLLSDHFVVCWPDGLATFSIK